VKNTSTLKHRVLCSAFGTAALCDALEAPFRNHLTFLLTYDILKLLVGIAPNLQLQCSWGQRWSDFFLVFLELFLYFYAFANNGRQRHCIFRSSFWPSIRYMCINAYFAWHDISVLTCSGGILSNLLQIFIVWVAIKRFTRSEVRDQGLMTPINLWWQRHSFQRRGISTFWIRNKKTTYLWLFLHGDICWWCKSSRSDLDLEISECRFVTPQTQFNSLCFSV